MTILIDGHNLIAHMPGISLQDPDDESRLVLRLRAYNARTRKKITVVFDHGIPGGWSRELSTGPVEVVFAGSHTNADRIIIERIRAAKTPPGLLVVSSDREVRQAAEGRGARVTSATEFAARLLSPPAPRQAGEADDVRLSPAEVQEWLNLFTKKRKHPSASSGCKQKRRDAKRET
ncbi:MAG: NYN domain-containing protein [Thermoflexales bacterium]|nr:NYN domain-containing protein [Thermoflexales bacterium]